MGKVIIDGCSLTIEQVAMVAREGRLVVIDSVAVKKINRSRDIVEEYVNREDHVSMGTIAARKSIDIKENLADVLAIEYLASAQGIDLRGEGELGLGTQPVYRILRSVVKPLNEDRIMYRDIQGALEIILSGKPVKLAEETLLRKL